MSEDVTRYQVLPLDPDVVYEPGVRALQAGYEEGQAYKALALALLTEPQRRALWTIADMVRVVGTPLIDQGALSTILPVAAFAAVFDLTRLELLTYNADRGFYRLTPFGARVADAIQGEG